MVDVVFDDSDCTKIQVPVKHDDTISSFKQKAVTRLKKKKDIRVSGSYISIGSQRLVEEEYEVVKVSLSLLFIFYLYKLKINVKNF